MKASDIIEMYPQSGNADGVDNPFTKPDYIFEFTDNDGEPTGKFGIDYKKYSEYLKQHFRIIIFKNNLYIYDRERCLYKQHTNEIKTHTRDTFINYDISGKLASIHNEVTAHIISIGCEPEYPFNKSPDCIPVQNGIVKISYDTGKIELLSHAPAHKFTYKLGVTYNPDIPIDAACNLLKEWVDDERVLLQIPAQALLQMQMGQTYKKAHILQGEPHAGKSTFLNLLIRLFSAEFTASVSLQQLCEDRFVGGKLEGMLLNIYDDLEDVPLGTVDGFKTLTGSCNHGIERKYENGYVGKITTVHVFTCNYPPCYPDRVMRDPAFWERWEYVRFPFSYPVDPNFNERVLTDEMLSSLFNAILQAMLQIRKSGLLVKSDVQTVMMQWNINSDPIYEFIEWGFGSGDGKTINKYSKQKLYAAYLKFCNERNIPIHRTKTTITGFTQALQPHNFMPMQIRVKGQNCEVYGTLAYKVNPSNIPDLSYPDDMNAQTSVWGLV